MNACHKSTITAHHADKRLFIAPVERPTNAQEVLGSLDSMRKGPAANPHDRVFESAINKGIVAAEAAFEKCVG